MRATMYGYLAAAAMCAPLALTAQTTTVATHDPSHREHTATAKVAGPDTTRMTVAPATRPRFAPAPIVIQNYKPTDQRGLGIFETPKEEGVSYEGFRLGWGAAFTQQFQALSHRNTADVRMQNNVNQNELIRIGKGFNNATANLYLNAQLARGIRVAMTSYLSSRRHNETWVKDGYLLVDASPFENALLDRLMQYVTVKFGHFEVNYGDAHFRRTDNGNGMHNPFVGNLLMDAFTTEIGAEVYVRARGFLAMGSFTSAEIRGNVARPEDRAPGFIGKIGYDRRFSPGVRVRLTGSTYIANQSPSNTLYTGDRGGSRYYMVVSNTAATESNSAASGLVNPGFGYRVNARMLNPFIQVGGLELFGTMERASGRTKAEATDRTWNQYAGEAVYRFLANDRAYVGARRNVARGELLNIAGKPELTRSQIGAGFFLTPNVLMKAEYVTQKYEGFPASDIRNGARFRGMMIEGVVSF